MLSVREGASVIQAASLVLLEVPAQRCLVLDVGHLVLVVHLLVAFFISWLVLVLLLASLVVLADIIAFLLVAGWI